MPTGFAGLDTLESLQDAIANRPAVEVVTVDERDIPALLRVCWHEFFWNNKHANSAVQVDAAQALMAIVCEALEVDIRDVISQEGDKP